MDLLLAAGAGRAQDIAEILSTIRKHDPDHAEDITRAILRLNELGWELKELDDLIDDANGVITRPFAADLALLQDSVTLTLQDVWTILGKIHRSPDSLDYRMAWKDIYRYCMDMGRQALDVRIDLYKSFAHYLCKMFKRRNYDRRQIEWLRHEIEDVRSLQLEDRRLISMTAALEGLAVVPRQMQPMRQPRSEERIRPPDKRTMSPTSSDTSYRSLEHQAAPSPPPLSPTTTFSTVSHTSSIEHEKPVRREKNIHWATTIFNDLPSTPLKSDKEISQCFGEGSRSGRNRPDAEFESILQLKFPGGLRIQFFWRPRDYRSKIVCEWSDKSGRPKCAYLGLSDLHIRRAGPLLYLCRPTPAYTSTVWTMLKFTSVEWLVVFHCTFLSLRSHDSSRHTPNTWDHYLKGERSVFAGKIRDSGYRHALRVFQDKETGAVRLEASVLDGDMKDTPIWTAFITHNVSSPTWCRLPKTGSTVFVAELRRVVFSSNYKPRVAANGENYLEFETEDDAEDFVETIDELAEKLVSPPEKK